MSHPAGATAAAAKILAALKRVTTADRVAADRKLMALAVREPQPSVMPVVTAARAPLVVVVAEPVELAVSVLVRPAALAVLGVRVASRGHRLPVAAVVAAVLVVQAARQAVAVVVRDQQEPAPLAALTQAAAVVVVVTGLLLVALAVPVS